MFVARDVRLHHHLAQLFERHVVDHGVVTVVHDHAELGRSAHRLDVMDDPDALESEWERKQAVPALAEYYDDIWVYGLPEICDPLAGLSVPASVRRR